jgi:hypothetical protein
MAKPTAQAVAARIAVPHAQGLAEDRTSDVILLLSPRGLHMMLPQPKGSCCPRGCFYNCSHCCSARQPDPEVCDFAYVAICGSQAPPRPPTLTLQLEFVNPFSNTLPARNLYVVKEWWGVAGNEAWQKTLERSVQQEDQQFLNSGLVGIAQGNPQARLARPLSGGKSAVHPLHGLLHSFQTFTDLMEEPPMYDGLCLRD